MNKAQLADSLSRHFHSLPVVEKEAITYFLYMIKVIIIHYNPLQLSKVLYVKKELSFDVKYVAKYFPTDLIYYLADRAESTRSPGGEDILLNH